jgi:hypothetical protein
MRIPFAALSILGAAALTARLALGSCIMTSLDVDIRASEAVLIGTVVARDQIPGERPGTSERRYRLNGVRFLKGGGPSDSLIVVQGVGDGPEYGVGERYVIRLGRDGGGNRRASLCQTPYTVRVDSSLGKPVIYAGSAPLIEFSDSTMVWGVGEGYDLELAHGIFLRRDNGARVTEPQFIETMTRIIHRVGESPK